MIWTRATMLGLFLVASAGPTLAGPAVSLADIGPTQPTRLALSQTESLTPELPQRSSAETGVQPRTAIGHRFASDGLVGQVGYLCGLSGIGPDSERTRGGPGSTFGGPNRYLGANLSLPLP